MERRKSRTIAIGQVTIGGENPVAVQSMTNTKTENIPATVDQIHRLTDRGCEIIRCAVPTLEAAQALKEIRKQIAIPLVADIHFDYRLALAALESGVDALRLNPGNIGGRDRVEKVVEAARQRQVPIRIGVNAGSLPKDLLAKIRAPYGGSPGGSRLAPYSYSGRNGL